MAGPIEHHDLPPEESVKFRNPEMALAAINSIDSVIQITTDVNVVLDQVMDVVLEVFNSSRAWLFHPCNPKLPYFDVTCVFRRIRTLIPIIFGHPFQSKADTLQLERSDAGKLVNVRRYFSILLSI